MRAKKAEAHKTAAVAIANAKADVADNTKVVQEFVKVEVSRQIKASNGEHLPLPLPPRPSPTSSTPMLTLSSRKRRRRCSVFVETETKRPPYNGRAAVEATQKHHRIQLEGSGQTEARGWWKKRTRSQRAAEGEEAEEGRRMKIQRLNASPPARECPNSVLTWVHPPVRFHRLKPETYPKLFLATPALQCAFVVSRMTCLFYDTRITNRAFHNMTNVTLSDDQVRILAYNSKFAPKPPKTSVTSVRLSFDDFCRRLTVAAKSNERGRLGPIRGQIASNKMWA